MHKISFIGLGVMGYPMAGHLAAAGFTVTVYNRTPDKAERWSAQHPGQPASSLAEAAREADMILTCVGDDSDLQQIYLGNLGLLEHARPGCLLIDHTTASADIARQLARHAQKRQLDFIDAPVSGGQQGAERGQLTIMCGGSEAGFARAIPVLEHYARSVQRMGESGAGQLTKMVNQIAVAGLLQGLSEGMHLAERSGLDVNKVIEVISKGAAQSWQMDNRAASMIAGHYNHGFAVDWMRKDLAICLNEARHAGASLPVTALVDQFYADVQAQGGGRWDTSSLLERLRRARNTK